MEVGESIALVSSVTAVVVTVVGQRREARKDKRDAVADDLAYTERLRELTKDANAELMARIEQQDAEIARLSKSIKGCSQVLADMRNYISLLLSMWPTDAPPPPAPPASIGITWP